MDGKITKKGVYDSYAFYHGSQVGLALVKCPESARALKTMISFTQKSSSPSFFTFKPGRASRSLASPCQRVVLGSRTDPG